jgi:predicted SpoU family rRNA methylase
VRGDHHAEDGIAEELEPFVRLVTRVLGAPGSVRDREREQVEVVERVAERFGKSVEVVGVQEDQPRRATT